MARFPTLRHEGNVPGLTVEIMTGTEIEAKLRAVEMDEALAKDQRDWMVARSWEERV
jgi:hypothetical protein